MSESDPSDARALARLLLGREVSPEEAEAYGGRLAHIEAIRALLRERAADLAALDPALVYRVPVRAGEDQGHD
ncbi:MAG: hypothetical protein D6826_01525 [Alphaproteobacteria bacterium]|nr:MAG: hypothetical protein D6826_01525 [Alphaproteobacteria bacterium]